MLGLPVRLRPRVVNHSKTESAEVTVGVFLDEKEVARASMTLKPGETATKEIVYVPTEAGTIRGRFEIPADRFPDDDTFLFTLVGRPANQGRAGQRPPRRRPVRERGAVPADRPGHRPRRTTPRQRGEARAEPGVRPVARRPRNSRGAGERRALLRDAGVVILANCGGLNADQFKAAPRLRPRAGAA